MEKLQQCDKKVTGLCECAMNEQVQRVRHAKQGSRKVVILDCERKQQMDKLPVCQVWAVTKE